MPDQAASSEADLPSEPEYSAPSRYPIESVDNARRVMPGTAGALQCPKAVEPVDALPRTTTGKVLKRERRQRYVQEERA